MDGRGDLSGVVDALYDAAVGLRSWDAAIAAVAAAVGAQSGLIFTPSLSPADGLFVGHGLDPQSYDAYGAYYHTTDLWYQGAERAGLHRAGVVATSDDVVSARDFEISEWHNDFCRPLGIHHLLSGIVSTESHTLLPAVHLSLFRPRTAAPFAAAERAALAQLHPHLERALVIRARMAVGQTAAAALTEVLNHLNMAVVLLRPDGRVDFANRAAEALLSSGDGLSLRASGLCAAASVDHAALRTAISQATGTVVAAGGAANACMVARPSGARPYQIVVIPVSGRAVVDAPVRSGAVAFIIDPDAAPAVPAERIARLLGLTRAEARLAAGLAGGASLADYAESAGISIGTARWTLKQVLAKTGAEKQSALVALVLRSAIVREPPM